jgi:DNA-binding response OmpR family regulator
MYRDIKVLLVEDDTQIRHLLDAALQRKHFDVTTADSLTNALSMLNKAHILIVDLGLPNGNGRMLLKQWNRNLNGSGPSCIITGTIVDGNKELADTWNVLQKPFDPDLLVATVERYAAVVRGTRCCAKVQVLEKRMRLMWIVIAALAGTEIFLPLIKQLIALLAA